MKKILIPLAFYTSIFTIPLLLNLACLTSWKTILSILIWTFVISFEPLNKDLKKGNKPVSKLLVILFAILTILTSVVEWAYFPFLNNYYLTVVGLTLLGIGLAIRLWSLHALGKNFSRNICLTVDHEVISSGPYQFVRHPAYLGAIIMFLGQALFLNSIFGIAVVLIFLSRAYIGRIKAEENFLTQNYPDYLVRSNRWLLIPFLY